MPPRKSNVSTVSNGPDEAAESPATKAPKDGMSVEDLSLPKSMIARLAKGVLPPNTQIQKDALLALHKSATVFVSYIASNSNENARSSNKKTIAPADVIAALKDAELESFLPRVEAELKRYNDIQCEKRNNYRRKVKEEKAAAVVPEGGEGDNQNSPDGEGDASRTNGSTGVQSEVAERPAKKLRTESGGGVVPDTDGGDMDDVEDADEQDDEEASEEEDDDDDDDDEVAEDESGEDGDGTLDQTMEDVESEEGEEASGMRDEALDEPDSD